MYLNRHISRAVLESLNVVPVIAVTGPRQAGKSTLLQRDTALSGRRYLTLDDPTVLAAARRSPETLLGGGPLNIDEAQKAPVLFPAIKILVDRDRAPGQFVLSGSANFLLMRAISESLAGRAVHLHLGPLTWAEQTGAAGFSWMQRLFAGTPPAEIFTAVRSRGHGPEESDWVRGGLPPAALEKNDAARRIWFTGYEQTYLERDLRDLTQVADLSLFHQFVRLTALRTAQVLNLRDLARDCGSNPVTISRWLSLLETGFLVRRLPPYFSSHAKRLVKAPKIYLSDSGLAAFLCGIHSGEDLSRHALRGALAETYVCQNLAAWIGAFAPQASLMHYRSHAGHEVDFVIEWGNRIVGIEAKAAARIDERDVKGLTALVESDPRCLAGVVLYLGRETVPLGPKIWAVPLDAGLV